MFDMDADGKLTRIGRWRLPPPADHGRMMVGLQRDGRQYLYLSIKPEGNWKDWPVNPAIPEPGLYMLDVTDAKDIQVYHLGKQPMFSTIAEGYGYIIQGSRLDIYALDRPTSPRRISGYQATGNITGLSIEQGHAWLTVQGSSLELIDVNEAYAPRLLAQSNEGDMRHATSLAAQGDWAYVLESGIGYDGPDGGMHVFHWHDGQLQHIRHATWGRSNMQRITLAGNAAYVTDQYYGLWRFDISQPDLPQRGALFMSAGENQQLLIEKKYRTSQSGVGRDGRDPRRFRSPAHRNQGVLPSGAFRRLCRGHQWVLFLLWQTCITAHHRHTRSSKSHRGG